MDSDITFLIKMCREIVKKIGYVKHAGPLVLNCRELLSIVFQNK